MSTPVAIRFDDDLLDEVRRVSKRTSTTVSSLVQTFTAEALRAKTVPGIVFRDGPAGRRAGVAGSLDVWEVVAAAKEVAEPHDLHELAADLAVPVRVVSIALDYYARWPEDIDEWVADNDREAASSRLAWHHRQDAAA